MEKRKSWGTMLALLFSLAFLQSNAQVVNTPVEEWTTQAGTQYQFYKSHTITDGSGNIYTTGSTVIGNGNHDILTIKYNSSGVQQWAAQYTGAGNGDDAGARITLDGTGNVFVVGAYYASSTDSNNCILIKYNSSGTQQWASTYDGGQGRSDGGTNLKIDPATDEIYVCGVTYTNSTDQYDFLILKYSPAGIQQWVRQWDNANLYDGAHKINFASGKLTVSGGTQINSTRYDYASVQYNASGTFQTSTFAGGSSPIGFNRITGMVVDASNNIYITGSVMNSNYDWCTMKLDHNLNQLWTATYNNSANMDDEANDIQVDASGNVYVTGYAKTSSQGKNYITIKYNSSGSQQWAASYNGDDNRDDEAYALVLNSSGIIYVTGASYVKTDYDYCTVKYDNSGNQIWDISYNSTSSRPDKATDICLDSNSDLIVTGQNGSGSSYTYTTVKYSDKSIAIPVDLNNEPPIASHWYYQNRGQLFKLDHTIERDVKYYSPDNHVFFHNTSFSYLFHKFDTAEVSDTIQRVDVTFSGGNTNAKVYAYEKGTDYLNFFNSSYTEMITRVEGMKRLYIPDIYSNVDIQFYSNPVGFKYYLVVKPGGNPASISMRYNGQTSVSHNGSTGELSINHKGGTYKVSKPLAYQMDASGNITTLNWQPNFSLTGTSVSFSTGIYDTSKYLILEVKIGNPPTSATTDNKVFSTYVGGGGTCEAGLGMYAGNANKLYNIGTIYSTGWPGATGGFQVFKKAWQDAYLLMLHNNGARICGTYYGGNGADIGTEITIGRGDTIYFSGETDGGYAFPSTGPFGSYVEPINTGSDFEMFVAKAYPGMQALTWSTMIGGDQTEEWTGEGIEMVVDSINNELYIGGEIQTSMANDFPLLQHTTNPNAFYQSTLNGYGTLAKFNASTCKRIWSTYFPGRIQALALDDNKNLYVAGSTDVLPGTPLCSTPSNGGFPLCGNAGFYQDTLSGPWDGFITKFDRNGNIKHSTYFGGNNGEIVEGIIYKNGKIFISGYTDSPNGNSNPTVCCGNNSLGQFPTYDPGNGYFQNSLGGASDIFAAKLDSSFGMQWSTYYGGTATEWPYSMTVHSNDDVFIGGQVYNGVFPDINHGNNYYYQSSNADPSDVKTDAFVLEFASNNNASWATYFGGYNSSISYNCNGEVIKSMAINGNDLWVSGVAYSTPGGAWPYRCDYPNIQFCRYAYEGDLSDSFLARFDLSGSTNGVNQVEPQIFGQLFLFPNPTTGEVTVRYNPNGYTNPRLRIFNYLGQCIYNETLENGTEIRERNINISHLSKGIYIVQIADNTHSTNQKLVKE